MFGLGSGEILIVGLIVLLLFGASKLPQLGSSMGLAIKNFKKGLKQGSKEPTDDSNKIEEDH